MKNDFDIIEKRDENIYRAIFNVNPLQIRNGGTGGSNRYSHYENLKNKNFKDVTLNVINSYSYTSKTGTPTVFPNGVDGDFPNFFNIRFYDIDSDGDGFFDINGEEQPPIFNICKQAAVGTFATLNRHLSAFCSQALSCVLAFAL